MIRRRHPTEPLGISIAGGIGSALGDVPIFIADVDEKGPAYRVLSRAYGSQGRVSEFFYIVK